MKTQSVSGIQVDNEVQGERGEAIRSERRRAGICAALVFLGAALSGCGATLPRSAVPVGDCSSRSAFAGPSEVCLGAATGTAWPLGGAPEPESASNLAAPPPAVPLTEATYRIELRLPQRVPQEVLALAPGVRDGGAPGELLTALSGWTALNRASAAHLAVPIAEPATGMDLVKMAGTGDFAPELEARELRPLKGYLMGYGEYMKGHFERARQLWVPLTVRAPRDVAPSDALQAAAQVGIHLCDLNVGKPTPAWVTGWEDALGAAERAGIASAPAASERLALGRLWADPSTDVDPESRGASQDRSFFVALRMHQVHAVLGTPATTEKELRKLAGQITPAPASKAGGSAQPGPAPIDPRAVPYPGDHLRLLPSGPR